MAWHKLFFPGMWLMRRMRMASKLVLLGALVVVPLCVLQGQLLQAQRAELESARDASLGATLVGDVSALLRLVQNHRGQTQMWLAQDTAAGAAREATQGALKQALQAMSAHMAPVSRWPAARAWDDMAPRVQGLAQHASGTSLAQSFAQHSLVVEDLERLAQALAQDSSLLAQSDGALAAWAAQYAPQWAEQVARLRGQGAGALRQPELAPEKAWSLMAQADQLEAGLRAIRHWQTRLGEVPGLDKTLLDVALSRSSAFAALARERFGAPQAAAGADAGAFFAAGSQALDAVQAFQSQALSVLGRRLEVQAAKIQAWYWGSVAVSVLGVALLVYLMTAFRFSILADLRQVLLFLQQMAEGNLRHRARVRGRDELGDMSDAMERMVYSFSSMVASVRSNAALVRQSGADLVQASNALADRTEQQAANLEQTNASVQELSANVQANAQSAQESDSTAHAVRALADKGAQSMAQAVAQIEAIQDSTRRMDEIVAVIDGLAFQTNILALNAAVEAARAGESGRGFAVVASEVRTLAQRSAASAKEIRALITTSTDQVGRGVELIRGAGDNIAQVVEGIRTVAQKMSVVSSGSSEQSLGLSEISAAVKQLDQITQQNAAMVESAAHQATGLQEQAVTLSESVSVFQLQQGTADEARALVDRAMDFKARCHSREEFLRGITNPQGVFFDRDMYVFGLSTDGRYVAFGGNPTKVNLRVQDVPGVDGQGLVDEIWRQARLAPGWVQYDYVNPTTGKVQTKMSFVLQAEPDLAVGCGVYKHFTG